MGSRSIIVKSKFMVVVPRGQFLLEEPFKCFWKVKNGGYILVELPQFFKVPIGSVTMVEIVDNFGDDNYAIGSTHNPVWNDLFIEVELEKNYAIGLREGSDLIILKSFKYTKKAFQRRNKEFKGRMMKRYNVKYLTMFTYWKPIGYYAEIMEGQFYEVNKYREGKKEEDQSN